MRQPTLRPVQMDAAHDPADLRLLLAGLAQAHVVVGSRYAPGGRVVGRPRLVSKWGNRCTRAVLGLDVHDLSSDFRAVRAEVVRALPLAQLAAAGRCFPVEFVRQEAKLHGVLASLVRSAGRNPGPRRLDLQIAVTAAAARVLLLTTNPADFTGLERLVTVLPAERVPPVR